MRNVIRLALVVIVSVMAFYPRAARATFCFWECTGPDGTQSDYNGCFAGCTWQGPPKPGCVEACRHAYCTYECIYE